MNFYKLLITIFLATLLLPMVSAIVPTATIDVPDTAMQGENWEIVLDCPEINGWPGDASDYCLVEWTGPDSGSFEENDGDNPHPDAVNEIQSLDQPGIYTYTIKECTTTNVCGPVVDSDTITIIADANPGTL